MRYPPCPEVPRWRWLPRALLFALALPLVVASQRLAAQDRSPAAHITIHSSAEGLSPYCCPDTWLFVDTEYLFWWARGAHVPPLVTTSPAGTVIDEAGVLGEAGTDVLFGGQLTSSGPRSGLHLRAGMALDDAHEWWLVSHGWMLPSYTDHFYAASPGNPILARPFFDPAIQRPNAELIAYPGLVAGHILVDADHDMWGAGIALQRNLVCCTWPEAAGGYRTDVLLGYRYLELTDALRVDERLTATDPQGPLLVGTRFELTDLFRSQSEFHGIDLGLRGELTRHRNFIAGEMRVALGQTSHRLDIDGRTRILVPGTTPITFPGGLLASGGWLGSHRDREFAVVPQAELRVGRRFTDHLQLSIGYTFLHWSQVVRAAEQIRTVVDSSQLPSADSTPGAPAAVALSSSSFWAQGMTARLEWQY